jgi:hypothetical protein
MNAEKGGRHVDVTGILVEIFSSSVRSFGQREQIAIGILSQAIRAPDGDFQMPAASCSIGDAGDHLVDAGDCPAERGVWLGVKHLLQPQFGALDVVDDAKGSPETKRRPSTSS